MSFWVNVNPHYNTEHNNENAFWNKFEREKKYWKTQFENKQKIHIEI